MLHHTRLALPLLALALLTLPACLPNRVTIDLAPGTGELEETAVLSDEGASNSSPKVALIEVSGLLSETPKPGLIASRANAVDSLLSRLSKAAGDSDVRAVILLVNSPGGTVGASDTMYHELRYFREKTGKPIVVSMGEMATSGAYYTSLAADRIIAQPTSITGSIGVLVQTFNFSEGMKKVGITGRAVVSGPNKDMTNPFEPPNEEQYALVQNLVDEFYAGFRALVAERRPQAAAMTDKWDMMTDGRVFTGTDALKLHLVDQTGTLRDAFGAAKRLAGIERARLVKYHSHGIKPQSPYGATAHLDPRLGATTNVKVLSLDLGPEALGPGFYYVWWPLSP